MKNQLIDGEGSALAQACVPVMNDSVGIDMLRSNLVYATAWAL